MAQFHVNREWEVVDGNPIGLEWTSSITNSTSQLLHVGNTSIGGEGANILTTKYDTNWSKLYHFGSNDGISSSEITTFLEATSDTIRLREQVQSYSGTWFAPGDYVVNVYRVDAAFNHFINPADSIYNYWARPSSSTVYESIVGDSLLPREREIINYCAIDSANLTGYVYQVYNLSGGFIGWLPHDTTVSNLKFEYSILSRDTLAPALNVSLEEITFQNGGGIVYPNPSTNSHVIVLETKTGSDVRIDLFDIQGRAYGKVFESVVESDRLEIPLSTEQLSPGVYLYRIKMDDTFNQIRFVRQ